MNAVRIEIVFPGPAPAIAVPCVIQKVFGSALTIISPNTPTLRAHIAEIILANPDVRLVVSPCFVAQPHTSQDPHEMVRQAFEGAEPVPLSFNIKEAAKRLGISYSHIRNLIHLGCLKKVRGRISSAELERFLNNRRAKDN